MLVVARWMREGLLTLAAVGGLLCIVAVVASSFFGLSLVVFSSGSMSPTIPEGSVAVVREAPATSVAVGDVVTVENPRSTMPVTHRVVAIEPDPSDPDTVVLTMKGDANADVDPFTYRVDEVRKVMWSMPRAGTLMGVLRSPFALGVTTIAVALLVVWVFWPRERRGDALHDARQGGH